MSFSKYLTDAEILELLQPVAEEVKLDMKMISKSAIAAFYADYKPMGGYVRTYGFYNIVDPNMRCDQSEHGTTITLVFGFDGFDVQVSQGGDPDMAFEADFVHGFHGAPRNIGNRTYSWFPVVRMNPSPWDMINQYVDRKY